MSEQTELVRMPKQEVAARREQPTIFEMMQKLIDQPGAGEKVAAITALAELKWKMEKREDEKDFAQAFSELQKEIRSSRIEATEPVPSKDGTLRYRFAKFEKIMDAIEPMLTKHGFTVCFSFDFSDGRMIAIGTLTRGGHEKVFRFPVRIGAGPMGASESQADGAAGSVAKRYCLCNMLGITIRKLDDAAVEGEYISPEQVAELNKRVQATGTDVRNFLRFAGAKVFEEIPVGRYTELDQFLSKRERLKHANG